MRLSWKTLIFNSVRLSRGFDYLLICETVSFNKSVLMLLPGKRQRGKSRNSKVMKYQFQLFINGLECQ